MLSDNFTVNVSPSLVPSGVVKDTPHVSCSPSPASKVPGVVVFSVRILTLGFIISLLISLPACAATASGTFSSAIPSAFVSFSAGVLSEIFSSTNVCASRLELAFNLLAISFSIPSISLSVKPACFRACFCESVSVKASLPSTTASSFSSEASSFCEVASVSSVAVFSFVVASSVAFALVFFAAVVTTSLACSLFSLMKL